MIRWYRVAEDPRVRVGSLGLACCALEVESAVRLGLLVAEESDAASADRTVLLVTGTMTGPLAPVVAAAVRQVGPEVEVLAGGACASTGGPYWDAPSVVPGIDHEVSVTAYVPGCPPRPEALVDAVLGRTVPA